MNIKKHLSRLLAIAISAVTLFSFNACDNGEGSGSSDNVSSSITVNGSSDNVSSSVTVDGSSDNVSSSVTSEEETTTLTNADYAALYADVAERLWVMADYEKDEQTSSAKAMRSVITNPEEITDASSIKALKQVMATMGAVVQMLADYCENEDFIVSDKPVTLTATASIMGMQNTFTMTFCSKIDQENNMIYLDWYGVYPMIGMPEPVDMQEYDYAEIGYDFDGNKGVTSFRFITKRGYEGAYNYDEEKIDESGKAYRANASDAEFIAVVDELKASFMQVKETEEIVLTQGNFDAEFQKYMDTTMDIMSQA